MQKKLMAEKAKLVIDGVEYEGLTKFGELKREKGKAEVAEVGKKRKIVDGQIGIPEFTGEYTIRRSSPIFSLFESWFTNNEVKDCVRIRIDGHGNEFARTLLPACECSMISIPPWDGKTADYARVEFELVPYDLINLLA